MKLIERILTILAGVLGTLLGLLMLVMFVTGYWSSRRQAQLTQCASNLRQISKALESCQAETGQLPERLQQLSP